MVESVDFVPDLLIKGNRDRVPVFTTFSTLIERANHWLRQNASADVIHCETVSLNPVDGHSHNPHFDSSWTGTTQFVGSKNDVTRSPELKALRVWYKNTNTGSAQRVGATLVVPRLTGVEEESGRPVYELLQDTLNSVNRSLTHQALPGSLLATETVRLFADAGSKELDPELTYKVFPCEKDEKKVFDVNCIRIWFKEGKARNCSIGYEDFVPVLKARRMPLKPVYETYNAVWRNLVDWVAQKEDIMLTNIQSLNVEELNDEGTAAVDTANVSFHNAYKDAQVRVLRVWYLNDRTKRYRPAIKLEQFTLQTEQWLSQGQFEMRFESQYNLVDRVEEKAKTILERPENWQYLNLQTISVDCWDNGNADPEILKGEHLPHCRKYVTAFFVIQEDGTESAEDWEIRVDADAEAKATAEIEALAPPPPPSRFTFRASKLKLLNPIGQSKVPFYRDFIPERLENKENKPEYAGLSSIIEEANAWLEKNRQVRVINVETRNLRPWAGRGSPDPVFSAEWSMSQDWLQLHKRKERVPILKSIRLWYMLDNEGPPSLIRHTFLEPKKDLVKSTNTFAVYETFEATIERFNKNRTSSPIEGPILNCELDQLFVGEQSWTLNPEKTYEPFQHKQIDVQCIRVWHTAGGERYETIGYKDFSPLVEEGGLGTMSATVSRASDWMELQEDIQVTGTQILGIKAAKDHRSIDKALKYPTAGGSYDLHDPWFRAVRVWYKRVTLDDTKSLPRQLGAINFIPKEINPEGQKEIRYETFEDILSRVGDWVKDRGSKYVPLSLQTTVIPSVSDGTMIEEQADDVICLQSRAYITLYYTFESTMFLDSTDLAVGSRGPCCIFL